MTETLHANIFFLITSFAVITVTIGVVWLLYHLIRVARDIRAIVGKVRRAGDDLEKDFQSLRSVAKEEGTKGRVIIDLVLSALQRRFTKKRSTKKSDTADQI